MAKTLQFRRGISADLDEIVGAEGEIFVDLDTNSIRVHDGNTAGGFALATATDATSAYSNAIAYVDAEIGALVNSAPGVLDTLNELAEAIGDDGNFFITVNNNINTAYSNAVSYADSVSDNAYTNAVSEATSLAGDAYTNAVSEATSLAGDAYTNAVSEATSLANDAFSNAVAYVDAQTTDTIEEGNTNLYFTESRARDSLTANGDLSYDANTGEFSVTTYKSTDFDTDFAAKDTDELTEGNTNLYYLDSRVDSHLSAANGLSYSLGTIAADQDISVGANVTFTKITGLATPASGQDAATKAYVDEVAEGLQSKPAAEVITVADLDAAYDNGNNGIGATLTASANTEWPEIDGYLITSTNGGENGVLVAGQANTAHNGRYNVIDLGSNTDPWILERCGVCDEPSEIAGAFVFIKHGTIYAGTGWVQTVADASTFAVGIDDITVTQFSQAGVYTANDGLILDGLDFRVDANIAGDYLTYTSGVLDVDASISANVNTIVLRGSNGDIYANTFHGDGAAVTNVNAATVGSNTAADLRAYADSAADDAYANAVAEASGTLNTLGTMSTQDASNVNISGGLIDTTSIDRGSINRTEIGLTTPNDAAFVNASANNISSNNLSVAGIAYPTTDGTNGQVMTTDGSGSLSFSTVDTTTNLGTSANSTTRTVTSSSGTNAVLPTANSTQAGVMSSSDRNKLDGIENNATADQTAAEIRSLVESATNSNVFTDADHNKLNGIAAGAQTGTVTSVSGTGSYNGLTLSGTVTGSGSLTLGGTPSGTWPISISGTATTASTANALNTGNNYRVKSLGVGTNASGTTGEIRATNNITAYYSDDRLKTKLGNIEDALEKVCSLNGFYYEANKTAQDLGYEAIKEVGVSAQEVQSIMPEVVVPAPIDDKYLTVRYEKIIPLLIEAIKDLKAEIETIKESQNG